MGSDDALQVFSDDLQLGHDQTVLPQWLLAQYGGAAVTLLAVISAARTHPSLRARQQRHDGQLWVALDDAELCRLCVVDQRVLTTTRAQLCVADVLRHATLPAMPAPAYALGALRRATPAHTAAVAETRGRR